MSKDFHALRSDLVSEIIEFITACEIEGRDFQEEMEEAILEARSN